MFKTKNPGKKIKEILAELGPSYCIKKIDFENCIYRDLQNGYDIEVSGLDNAKKSFKADVYVWKTSNGTEIVEKIMGIDSFEILKFELERLSFKYSEA